jgi:hypothetical protein
VRRFTKPFRREEGKENFYKTKATTATGPQRGRGE